MTGQLLANALLHSLFFQKNGFPVSSTLAGEISALKASKGV